jgi:hypothetical protein
MHVDDIIR